GSKGDFCEVLERFHAEEGGEQVGPAGGGTMIGEKERIVVRHVRLEYRAQIWRARGGVANERNFAEADDHFWQKRLIEAEARDGETRGGRRMAMANRVDIGAHAIKKKMHGGFGRDFAVTLKMRALHIHDDEVLRRHHAFVDTGGRGENAFGIQTNGEIAFTGDDIAAFVQPAANAANLSTILIFQECGSSRR